MRCYDRCYIKRLVTRSDGSFIMRWDLDRFTYKQVKEIVTRKYFDSLADDYRYEMRPYISGYQDSSNSTPVYCGALRCI